jgi:hypothetical protein
MTAKRKNVHIQVCHNAASFGMQGKLQLWKRQECKIGGYRRGVVEDSSRLEHDTVTSGSLMSGH